MTQRAQNVVIKQNDTVSSMTLACSQVGQDIVCTTDYPLLHNTPDVITAMSAIPVIGSIVKAGYLVVQLGAESTDVIMGKPRGETLKSAKDGAIGVFDRLADYFSQRNIPP